MEDFWKYPAFPLSAIAGYMASLALTQQVASITGLTDFLARIVVIGATGFFAGFLIDDLIPAYIEEKRSGGSGGVGDSDFGDGGDIDLGD